MVASQHYIHFDLSQTLVYKPIQQAKIDSQSKLKALQAEHAQLQENLDEEMEAKGAIQRQLANVKTEAATWKGKFENEATPRIEELEDGK